MRKNKRNNHTQKGLCPRSNEYEYGRAHSLFNCTPSSTCAPLLFILLIMALFTSCKHTGNRSLPISYDDAINKYRLLFYELCIQKELPTDRLCGKVKKWVRTDSLVRCSLFGDSTKTPNPYYINTYVHTRDSIQLEFNRLILSKKRTYKDAVSLMMAATLFKEDSVLANKMREAEPFFSTFSDTCSAECDTKTALRDYRSFLNKQITKGIHGKNDMLSFIKGEDSHFRNLLSHLNELDDENINDIIHNTTRCCQMVFQSEMSGEITAADALVYMTIRTNHRLLQNALICIDHVAAGKVNTAEQAQAYVWMILQPYIVIDAIGVALLYPSDKALMTSLAEKTPEAITSLNKVAGLKEKALSELPYILMNLTIANIK